MARLASGERRRAAQQLIGLDHPLQPPFLAPVTAVAVGVVAADEFGIAAAQALAVGLRIETHHSERLALTRGEAGVFLPTGGTGPNVIGSRTDCVERVVEIRPARHPVDAGVRPEGARLGAPAGDGRLSGEDFLGAHPLEPVVPCVEFADVLEAEPAPIPRPVEAGTAAAGRAEFTRLTAARRLAFPPYALISSMELLSLHRH